MFTCGPVLLSHQTVPIGIWVSLEARYNQIPWAMFLRDAAIVSISPDGAVQVTTIARAQDLEEEMVA